VYGDDLLVGGDFVYADIYTPDTVTARRIARWDGTSWDRLAGGVSSWVRALTDYDDDLIVAGDFIYANIHTPDTVRARRIARWDGSQWDSLQSRSDFIVDILADDVDFAPDSADEIIVRGYHDPSPWLGWNPALAFWTYGVGEDFTGCTRSGNSEPGLWGIDDVHGSRRTIAVGDFVDDDNNYKDLVLLRTDPNPANANNILVFVIDTSVLAPCSSPAGPDLDSIAGWTDTSGIITDLITANLDTATIELRAPSYYNVDSIIQPLVILNVPPIHYDILDDTTWDVSNRYPWPPDENYETYCAYGNRQDWVTSVESEVRKDWGISAGLKTHFSTCGATVKAHLNTTYGEGFSVQGEHETTLSVIQVMEAHAEDMILAASIDYDIWEYPVYRRGVRLEGGDVVVVDPSEVRKVWFTGKEIESWITDHEVENIFSYARYPDLGDNPMVASEGVIEGYTWPMAPTSTGYFALRKEEFESSTVEESNNFGIEVGASIGYEGGLSFFGLGAKWGFEVSVEGTYSRSELNTYTTTFTTADSLHVQYGYINSSGSFEGNRKYEITPYAYWSKNGSLVLDYAAGPIVNQQGEDPTWWQNHYSDPDPAFILPWRLDPEKEGTDPGENRYKTREIVFIPKYPLPGDTVLIIARVHNFSLNPTLDPVKVSFYLGDPDHFGQLLYDKNTDDSVFWGCDADGFPAVIQSQGEAAAQMVWQVPDEGNITECQRIWAYIDPLDSITNEVHDNDAEITNNKGWNRLDVNTATDCCIGLNQWDNCPDVNNPGQEDTDGDGIGDACEGIVCGDANGDFTVNVGDAVFLIAYVFKGGPPPDPVCRGDANGDGDTNVGDAVYLIAYVFKGGPPPVEQCCP
jgi:hypothetical protein